MQRLNESKWLILFLVGLIAGMTWAFHWVLEPDPHQHPPTMVVLPEINLSTFTPVELPGECRVQLDQEPAFVFGNTNHEIVGQLTWENGVFKFEGEMERSARLFFDHLIGYMNEHLDEYCMEEKDEGT